MSNPRASPGDGEGDSRENTIAKAAGYLVFSGIAISILKTINPLNRTRNESQATHQPLCESAQTIRPTQPLFSQEHFTEKPITSKDPKVHEVSESSQRTIEIAKGDTLWGLSTKYGVSVNAIKEVNGLTGDTIYAGKKIIIP